MSTLVMSPVGQKLKMDVCVHVSAKSLKTCGKFSDDFFKYLSRYFLLTKRFNSSN